MSPTMSEADWQAHIIDMAVTLGWATMHVRRSVTGPDGSWTTATSVKGWPDLVLWSETQRRVLFAELKTDTGRVSPEQTDVMWQLRRSGQHAEIWRPRHVGYIRRVLEGHNPLEIP